MRIQKIHIQNFKSLVDLEIVNPNPFSVFVGPNGGGKSNIFEALEFGVYLWQYLTYRETAKYFDSVDNLLNANRPSNKFSWAIDFEDYGFITEEELQGDGGLEKPISAWGYTRQELEDGTSRRFFGHEVVKSAVQFFHSFSRIFLNNPEVKRVNAVTDTKILADGSGLEQVLERILKNEAKREEITEWLRALIPEFESLHIESSPQSGTLNYLVNEKYSNKAFPKRLVSDGTRNILALLTAIYQSDEPQFLCIEEPENGLHPHAIRELVELFRVACEEKGHFIWLNTHSETLVRQLKPEEIIVVDKKEGTTVIKQFQGENLYGLQMDEAWLTNALGGGIP